MTVKHIVASILVLAGLAFAAPALADPPQLRNDAAHFGSPGRTHQVAPDGWAAKYLENGSAAPAHPDNLPRFVPERTAGSGSSDRRAELVAALAFGAVLALGAGVVRTRIRRNAPTRVANAASGSR